MSNATQRQTDTARPSIAPEHTTHPPMARNRAAGIEWYERLISQTRPASGDAVRFMKGIK